VAMGLPFSSWICSGGKLILFANNIAIERLELRLQPKVYPANTSMLGNSES
jgi:hypothetical protein